MELIFDSIEERDIFFDLFCVDDSRWKEFGCKQGVDDRDCDVNNCKKCWEQSGVKYTIKDEKTPSNRCYDCKHRGQHIHFEPCKSCKCYGRFKAVNN